MITLPRHLNEVKNVSTASFTYITDLVCSACGKLYSARQINTYCPDCQAPLLSNYDLEAAQAHLDRDEISRRPRGMWRWHELLPVYEPENCIYLGEGDAPLLNLPRLRKPG